MWVYTLPCGVPLGKSQGLAGTKGFLGTGPRGCSVGPGSDAALGGTGRWHMAAHLTDDGASLPSRAPATPPVCVSGASHIHGNHNRPASNLELGKFLNLSGCLLSEVLTMFTS